MNLYIKKINDGNEEYTLKENDKTILRVRHRRNMHTARIETVNEQRILLIENEGLLKIRMAIKNEYGVEIGQMFFDSWSDDQGIVQIDTVRYRFTINKTPSQILNIYKGTSRNVVYQCNLDFDTASQFDLKDQSSAYIISIVWYLHLQAVKENKHEFIA